MVGWVVIFLLHFYISGTQSPNQESDFTLYIYISVNLGRIFSLIHVRLNNIAILAFTSFFSIFSKYLILLLVLQGKLKINSPKFILLFIVERFA